MKLYSIPIVALWSGVMWCGCGVVCGVVSVQAWSVMVHTLVGFVIDSYLMTMHDVKLYTFVSN